MTKTEDLDMLKWIHENSTKIQDSELRMYKGSPVSECILVGIYNNLKVTEIEVRGYNCFFTVRLHSEDFLNMAESIKHVTEDIISTAMVISIKHKNWLGERDILIKNPLYKEVFQPTKVHNRL